MISNRELLLTVVTRFLPAVVALAVGSLVAEPLLRGRDVLKTLRHIHLPLLVLQPTLISVGYLLGLWLLRGPFNSVSATGPHVFAALAAVALLSVISVLAQGAPLYLILTTDIFIGLVAAVAFFVFHVRFHAGGA